MKMVHNEELSSGVRLCLEADEQGWIVRLVRNDCENKSAGISFAGKDEGTDGHYQLQDARYLLRKAEKLLRSYWVVLAETERTPPEESD